VLNIGSTDTIDIYTLAETVRDEIDPSLPIEHDDRQAGDAEHTHADISKAQDRIGYEPTRSIRDGLQEFIDWYDDNREWYEPLVRSS